MATRKNPILNYTTTISVLKTVSEITSLLSRKHAVSVSTDFTAGKPTAITFVIVIGEQRVPFRLEPKIAGVARLLPGRDPARAERVAWRILYRWTEAQMAMVESSQAEMGQVFLPYAVGVSGETFWHAFQESKMKQLGTGK